MAIKADLHCHSRCSDQPEEWLLRRLGARESYTEPRQVYDLARRRGMDLVTITDHNEIRGALEIAGLPEAFVSVEATASFPEDRCRIHVLVFDVTEDQFGEIQRLRDNLYDLQAYLQRERLAHSVAHPLLRVGGRFSLWHLERLLLLFPCFEVVNASRHRSSRDLMHWLLSRLSAGLISDLANTHDLEPVGESPWVKGRTGGSDDHSGLFVAKAYTVADGAEDRAGFLDHLRRGLTRAEGTPGTAQSFAHTLYAIAHQFYRSQFRAGPGPGGDLLGQLLREFFESETPGCRILHRIRGWGRAMSPWKEQHRREERAFKEVTIDALREVMARDWQSASLPVEGPAHHRLNRETFFLASQLTNRLLFEFTRTAVKKFLKGSFFGSLQALSALGPVILGTGPYLFSYHSQNKDRRFLAEVRRRFGGPGPSAGPRPKRAWFTDTLNEVNGVATTVAAMAEAAGRVGADLTIVSSTEDPPPLGGRLKNFPPIGTITFPEYVFQPLAFPPVLNVVDYCERQGFTEVIISTTFSLGLTGLATARLLGLPAVGIYHTDLPEYALRYTQDEQVADLTRRYARWFYGQMDRVYVRSSAYREELADWGIPRERLRLLPAAVDLEAFHPQWRDPALWHQQGLNGETKLLYVGRLAREKDLDILARAYRQLRELRSDITLVVVGDGPYRDGLQRVCAGLPVLFTGFLSGESLSRAYASADIFVFPSSTDTLGNVVLEAQASGLPVVACNAGGPQDILREGITGLLIPRRDPERLAAAIRELASDASRRRRMGLEARQHVEHRTWDAALREFWSDLADLAADGESAPDSAICVSAACRPGDPAPRTIRPAA